MTVKSVSQELLKERLHYDPDTGVFTWKTSRWATWVGKRAGSGGAPYRYICIGKEHYPEHRLAFIYMTGRAPKQVDHINHDRHDNRWINLRAADDAVNGKNKPAPRTNTSGIVGVSWASATQKWVASIKTGGKAIFLGAYKDIEDAVMARKLAERKYGFHPNHGKTRHERKLQEV